MAEYYKKDDVLQIINNARDGDSLFAMMQILMLPPIESKIKALKTIDIPTPHGRLIDADALHYSRIRIAHNDGTIGGYNAVVMSAEIKDAPTIVEAEEES